MQTGWAQPSKTLECQPQGRFYCVARDFWALGDGEELGSGERGHSWEVGPSDILGAGRIGVEILDVCYSLNPSEPLQMRKWRCREVLYTSPTAVGG